MRSLKVGAVNINNPDIANIGYTASTFNILFHLIINTI
jgi:hypothetical protein